MVIGIPILLFAIGLLSDLFLGLPVSRDVKSIFSWIGGILGLGALYLLGEGAGAWIGSKDKVTDPLWRRVMHLMALMALCGACCLAVWLFMRLVNWIYKPG
jgi:hypothetical protein